MGKLVLYTILNHGTWTIVMVSPSLSAGETIS